jgi:micrococcal nuclease
MKLSFKLTKKQKTLIISGLILVLAGIFGVDPTSFKLQTNSTNSTNSTVKVISVIDGDTIVIEGGQKVRYIGINTPEFLYDKSGHKTGDQCFAKEATEENKKLVEGKTVKLQKDSSEKDKYGRLLRYVYVDNNFVNESLIKNGYARLMTIKPDTDHSLQFKTDQENAKENNLGLWKVCPTKY